MTEQDYLLIDQLVQGELSEKEQFLLQQRLEREPELSEALAFRQEAKQYLLSRLTREALLGHMSELNKTYFCCCQSADCLAGCE